MGTSRIIVNAIITFWTQHTGPCWFYLYPFLANIWTDSINEIIHISAENRFIITNSNVFIRLYIFVSEWTKKGVDLNSTPCICMLSTTCRVGYSFWLAIHNLFFCRRGFLCITFFKFNFTVVLFCSSFLRIKENRKVSNGFLKKYCHKSCK